MFWLIVFIATLSFVYLVSRAKQGPPSRRKSYQAEFKWPPIGDFEFEIVGESKYQDAIHNLAGDHGKDNARTECTAILIPEDDNPCDSKAMAVRIDGLLVGYMSRDNARSFRKRLVTKKLSGATTACDAIIVGGRLQKNGQRLLYGVKLDLKPFDYN